MAAQKTYLIYSAYFDLTSPGGGAVFSMDIVRELLQRGNRVHVICATKFDRKINDLETFRKSGQLEIHGMIPWVNLSRPHELNSELTTTTRALLGRINPDEIQVHNFQGFISSLLESVGKGISTTYVALDFGMSCFNFYRYDGSLKPCNGPEPKKCKACILRFEGMSTTDAPHHLLGMAKKALGLPTAGNHKRYLDLGLHIYLRSVTQNLDLILSLFKKFDHIVAPSPPVRESIIKYRGSDRGVHSILYPVSPTKQPKEGISPNRTNADPVHLIFLGNAHPIKGWSFFLQVLESLPDGLNLRVTDANENRASFDQASPRVKRYLTTCKRWPTDQVRNLFRDADAVLVPSLWHENTPLVVLEALANHLPVIASNQGGIRHVVQEGVNGFLLPPGELTPWKALLEKVVNEPSLLRGLRTQCDYRKSVTQFVDEFEAFA